MLNNTINKKKQCYICFSESKLNTKYYCTS